MISISKSVSGYYLPNFGSGGYRLSTPRIWVNSSLTPIFQCICDGAGRDEGLASVAYWIVADAIMNREGTRAEAMTREHSRNSRLSIGLALKERRLLVLSEGIINLQEAV